MNKILIFLVFILLFVNFHYLCIFIDKSLKLSIYLKKKINTKNKYYLFFFLSFILLSIVHILLVDNLNITEPYKFLLLAIEMSIFSYFTIFIFKFGN